MVDIIVFLSPVLIFVTGCIFTFMLKNRQFSMVKDFTVKEINSISKFNANESFITVLVVTLLMSVPCYLIYTPANQVDNTYRLKLKQQESELNKAKKMLLNCETKVEMYINSTDK